MTGFPCCPTCHRAILPGWIHETQPHAPNASHTVCSEHRRPREFRPLMSGPLTEVLSRYLDIGVALMSPLEWLRHRRRVEAERG